jgi:hypothetical protein
MLGSIVSIAMAASTVELSVFVFPTPQPLMYMFTIGE